MSFAKNEFQQFKCQLTQVLKAAYSLFIICNLASFLILGSQHPFSFNVLFHVNLISVKCKGQ